MSERTGYSSATISRILTGDPALAVTSEARQRVLDEAGRLNYAATKSRRGRAPKCLLRLGVVEMLTPAQRLEDPYYHYLHNYVEQACQENRFAFLPLELDETGTLPPREEKLDGIVAIGIFSPEQTENFQRLSSNVVFLDSSPDEPRSDSVVLNYRLGIEQALHYLLDLGHRKLGFVGPAWKLDDWKRPAPEKRRRFFLELTAKWELEPPVLIEAPMDTHQTALAVGNFLSTHAARPTALLTANEENAIGASRAIRDAGLQIPRDLSLISFNDTPLSELVEPPLTSISTHVREMANTAVRLAAERTALHGRPPVRTLPQKVVVPPSLVLRESAAPWSPQLGHEPRGGMGTLR